MAGVAGELPFSVLVVADHDPTLTLIEHQLTEAGYEVRAARDAQGAKQALTLDPAAIAIIESHLPDMSGLDLASWLREQHPETELILVTGRASVQTAMRGVELGACDCLLTPINDPSIVVKSVGRAANRLARRAEERRTRSSAAAQGVGRKAADPKDVDRLLLDRLPLAILLTDEQGFVRGKNRAAALVLAEPEGLKLEAPGRVTCSQESDAQALHAALARSCGERAVSALMVARDEHKPALRVLVAPVLPDTAAATSDTATREVAHRPRALAAVVVGHPERRAVAPDAEILGRLYGLTPAESELAARLVTGESLQEACTWLGIALPTARTHLQRIFAKTATTSQADLIRVLLGGQALLAAGVQVSGTTAAADACYAP